MYPLSNPLYKRSLEESDPALWSRKDIQALVVPGPDPYVSKRGRVPVITDPQPMECIMERLQVMNRHKHSERDLLLQIFDLIDFYMRSVGDDRQISVQNHGSRELKVNGESFAIPFHLGCDVDGITVFQLTDSVARYEERRQLIPDLVHEPQDEISTDAFDVAALIAQAASQKESFAAHDGIYEVFLDCFYASTFVLTLVGFFPPDSCHLPYLYTYKKLVVLTGWVPSTTITALKEGHEMIEPIILSREVIDVPSKTRCDWKEIDLYQIIAGFVDAGARALALESREP
ncbi:hypothetical protein C0995_010323 [Termitomyces sp. Mi166|nr:hypothetical protein C0995_010323 [Termitomyces sp. Mi166\